MAAGKKNNNLLNIGMIVAVIVLVAAIAMVAVGLSGTEEKPASSNAPAASASTSNVSASSESTNPSARQSGSEAKINQTDSQDSSKDKGNEKDSSQSKNASSNAANQGTQGSNSSQKKSSANKNSGTSSNTKPAPQKQQATHSVTISIVCDTILKNKSKLDPAKKGFVPQNGVILSPTRTTFEPGQTVFDVLKSTCRSRGIQLEFTGGQAYIEGINNLYEFDCGPQSGWMFKVNGVFPNYGCSDCVLKDNDTIVWCYTCEGLGTDVGGSRG